MFKMAVLLLTKQRICKPRFGQLRNLATVRRFVDPKNDIAFKKLFNAEQNKPLLLSFLNTTLRRKDDDIIEEVEPFFQELHIRHEDYKKSILDVSCRDRSGRRYIIEMQNKNLRSYIPRLEYYASRVYSDQLPHRGPYDDLRPVILVAVANYKVFPKEVQCISYHSNREEKTNKCFLPNLSYAFIELPKFNKRNDQLETPEDYWVHLLKEAANENDPPKDAPSEIQAAYEVLERHRWSSVDIESYEKIVMENLDRMDENRTNKEEGREEGRVEGREEGRVEGRDEGRDEMRNIFVRKLSEQGKYTPEEISDLVKFTITAVEKKSK